jgi:hypothetical protein
MLMGEMRRATAREEQQRITDRFASTLVIAASIIAAVRLARDDRSTALSAGRSFYAEQRYAQVVDADSCLHPPIRMPLDL